MSARGLLHLLGTLPRLTQVMRSTSGLLQVYFRSTSGLLLVSRYGEAVSQGAYPGGLISIGMCECNEGNQGYLMQIDPSRACMLMRLDPDSTAGRYGSHVVTASGKLRVEHQRELE